MRRIPSHHTIRNLSVVEMTAVLDAIRVDDAEERQIAALLSSVIAQAKRHKADPASVSGNARVWVVYESILSRLPVVEIPIEQPAPVVQWAPVMVPQKITRLLSVTGWTVEQLADEIGVTPPTIARWRAGKAKPIGGGRKNLRDLIAKHLD